MFCALRGNEAILIINTLISNSIFRRLVICNGRTV